MKRHMNRLGSQSALLMYVAFFLALTFPYWLLGEVVAPHRQSLETGGPSSTSVDTRIENRKFSDYANTYVPEVNAQLNGPRSGWLGTWTDRNELGRPLFQIFGFSRAYLPSWLIASITDSPQRFLTLFSLGTCFLAGLFMLMLCRELSLSPLAGLLAGGALSASPQLMYWLTFPMFLSVFCWAAGALYALTRLSRKPDLPGWSVLAFSVYSLLMTAYQQLVVFHSYILTGYGIFLAYRLWQSTGREPTIRYLISVVSAVAVGGILALPAYLDLAQTAADSARIAPDPAFFMAALPKLDSLTAVLHFLALSLSPEVLGNPVSPSYPLPYNGTSVTPLVTFLTSLGLLLCFRKTWGWWLALAVLCALAFSHSLYTFGIKYLGFNLSRNDPLFSATLPLTIIAAYSADALIRRTQANQHSRIVLLAALGPVLGLLIAVAFGLTQGLHVRVWVIVATLVVTALLVAQLERAHPILLLGALVAMGTYISFPLMLRQAPAEIVTTSPLVTKVRENLPPDSRYAVASPGLIELPPNLNAALGLPSIHSYNSLSSRRYHTLIGALGGTIETYGRWNGSISPDYSGSMFWMSNVALVLSPAKLEHENLRYLGEIGKVHLHRVMSRMGHSMQVIPPKESIDADGVRLDEPESLPKYESTKTLDRGDLLEFEATDSGKESLLILSQKFHPDWHAQTLTAAGWTEVKTLPVNGVFQGVLLPERTQKVRLQFEPYVRFAWIAHVFWLFLAILLIIRTIPFRNS